MKLLDELRVWRDHWYFRWVKRTRPLTIHTECLHKDNVWKAAQGYVGSGRKAIWYVVTPVNMDFVRAETGCDFGEKEYEKTILERYKWLQEHGQEIQAHVHLRIKMSMYEPSSKEPQEKIMKSVEWLRRNGFKVDKIVFGWWSFDDKSQAVAESLGLRVTQRLDNYFIHDYDMVEGII
ncbi:MAG: hypothetical protein JW834_01285 [Candidatus Diapherotrites archaeon]|nr:hypothetical protein [Candidatus Diapherotrites archaeon]